jgi:hypothetical protein
VMTIVRYALLHAYRPLRLAINVNSPYVLDARDTNALRSSSFREAILDKSCGAVELCKEQKPTINLLGMD